MIKIGVSLGFTFWYLGRKGRFVGRSAAAALIAAWTSRPAESGSRSRSNCRVIDVDPSELVDVMSVNPAMRPRRRSSGVATAEDMVSGLAPGRLALTEMVGRSTRGSGATGSWV